MLGFYRVAAAVPEIRVADVKFNVKRILGMISEADSNGTSLVVFPELSLCGYTCGDLFNQSLLISSCAEALFEIAEKTKAMKISIIVGAPILHGPSLYNTAVVIHGGEIKGIIPKKFIPNYREFYEKRWFSSGGKIGSGEHAMLGEVSIPIGGDLIFRHDEFFVFSAELCEDLWNVVPPSSWLACGGATVIANLSASNEIVSKSEYRRELVKDQSSRCLCAYVYASSGVWESSTDLVFGGHSIIAENGVFMAENSRFQRTDNIVYADIDCQKLSSLRRSESSLSDNPSGQFRILPIESVNNIKDLERDIDPHPFVPSNPEKRNDRCREIFSIQSAGLAKRVSHAKSAKAVIGISGGLDSTLALLACYEAFKLLGKKSEDIITVTMPGFGTGERTLNNAIALAKKMKTTLRTIDITDAC